VRPDRSGSVESAEEFDTLIQPGHKDVKTTMIYTMSSTGGPQVYAAQWTGREEDTRAFMIGFFYSLVRPGIAKCPPKSVN
jgi:hypothetical protein